MVNGVGLPSVDRQNSQFERLFGWPGGGRGLFALGGGLFADLPQSLALARG
jgi:hypothetical protein